MARPWKQTLLVLSGGNALGAFQAGAYQSLQEHDLLPDHVTGSSIGAVNGALIAGNAPEQRLPALRHLWQEIAPEHVVPPTPLAPLTARTLGRPGLFVPTLPRVGEMPVGQPALYDLAPLEGTLKALCRLEKPTARLTVAATDLGTGQTVTFDTTETTVEPAHIQGSCALLPDFVPVQAGDRLLGDGGLSANLPLNHALPDLSKDDTLVIAVDLFDARGEWPRTLLQGAGRRLEVIMASQARLEIDLLRQRRLAAKGGKLLVLRLTRDGTQEPVTDKTFDFSAATLKTRWDDGYRRMTAALQDLPRPTDCEAFTVLDLR